MSNGNRSINEVPAKARIALAAVLIKSLPPEAIVDMLEAMKKSQTDGVPMPMPDIKIVDGTGMSAEELQREFACPPQGFAASPPGRRPASVDEVAQFDAVHEPPLRVGDRVRWRDGYRNAEWPEAGAICVVSQIIEPPIRDTKDMTMAVAAQRNDIALAFSGIDEGSVYEFLYDSRRFVRVAESLDMAQADPKLSEMIRDMHKAVSEAT